MIIVDDNHNSHNHHNHQVTASPHLLTAAACTGLHIYLKLVAPLVFVFSPYCSQVFACVDPDIFLPKFVPREPGEQVPAIQNQS